MTLAITVALALLAAYTVLRTPVGPALGIGAGPPCTLDVGEETLEWSTAQAMTATTVAGIGTRIGASVNGVAAAVSRSLQPEPEEPIAPEAGRQIYRSLPDAATPAAPALAVARALLGYDGDALSCVLPLTGSGDLFRQEPVSVGLTPRADEVRREMRAVFGKQPLGGFDRDGVTSGHIEGSAHYEGRAIDIFFRPISAENQRRGYQQALWAVAHAQRLNLGTVIFDRRIWTARRSVEGWRDYVYPGGTDNPVLLHEDHVHLDVVEGDERVPRRPRGMS